LSSLSSLELCSQFPSLLSKWYPPQVSGDLPSGRSGHCATLLPASSNNELVIFGGAKSGKHLTTVSVLNTKQVSEGRGLRGGALLLSSAHRLALSCNSQWVWSSPKIQGVAPKARSYASATAIQAAQCNGGQQGDHVTNSKHAMINIRQRLVIFGGNDAARSFDTVHVLEKVEGAQNTWRWFHPSVSGSPPKARTGHSATLLKDQKTICIYGGWDPSDDSEDNIFQDCFLLDTEFWKWKKGPVPVYAGNTLSSEPSTQQSVSDGGARRVGHTAVLNTTKEGPGNEILIFGGRVPEDDFTGDFQTLTIPS
jgi:Galactose oxidase, central domain